MTNNLPSLIAAGFPMVPEQDATGRVAAVYGAILERMPMVPSLFKSLAVCPGYLELAWEQTRLLMGEDQFTTAARTLVAGVADAVSPPADPQIREVVGRFVTPLSRMLLVTAGLRLALDGTVSGPPATPSPLSSPARLHPDRDIPPTSDLDVQLVGAIRADLGTPIVNSIWRAAAATGLLDRTWQHFGPIARNPGFARQAEALAGQARDATTGLGWPAVASHQALAARDRDDAAAGIAAILDAYLATLPRVLTLAASSAET